MFERAVLRVMVWVPTKRAADARAAYVRSTDGVNLGHDFVDEAPRLQEDVVAV